MEGKIGKMKSGSEAGFQEIFMKVKVFLHTHTHSPPRVIASVKAPQAGDMFALGISKFGGRRRFPFLLLL